jgi:hypothetical protein
VPFVLAPELAAAAAAFLLAMLCIAVVYLIRAIAATLGTFNLGPISVPIGRWFSAITSPVVSWLVGATAELWADAAWWMHGIAYVAVGLFDDVKSALVHAFDTIDHVATVVVPGAAAQAVHDAGTFTGQQIDTITRDIADATTTIEKVATGDAARALAKAEGVAATVKGDLVRIVAHDLTVGEKYADAEIAKLRGYVDGAIAGIHLPTLESIGAAPAALVGTVAAAAAAVAAITAEYESCAVRTCSGNNNFSNLLQDALGVASFAVFAEWIKGAITDPQGAEATFAGAAQGLYSDADSLLNGLLSL